MRCFQTLLAVDDDLFGRAGAVRAVGIPRQVRPGLDRAGWRVASRVAGSRCLARLFQRLLRVHAVLGRIFEYRGGRRIGLVGGIVQRLLARLSTAAGGEQEEHRGRGGSGEAKHEQSC